MNNSSIFVRKATLNDRFQILKLINDRAQKEQLLPQTIEQVESHIRDYMVALSPDEKVIGCCALYIYSKNLSELRSLTVLPCYEHKGIGSKLTQFAINEARDVGVSNVFALTRTLPFFEKNNFLQTQKDRFPEKVYKDCLSCPKLHHCDETAVLYKIN